MRDVDGSAIQVCPAWIQKLFDNPATAPRGRNLAVDWLKTLQLKPGDKVWLPEIGWTIKEEGTALQ